MSKLYRQYCPEARTIDISDFVEDEEEVGWCADLCFFENGNLARRMTNGGGRHYLFMYEDYEEPEDDGPEPADWDAPDYVIFEGVGTDYCDDDDMPNPSEPYYPV